MQSRLVVFECSGEQPMELVLHLIPVDKTVRVVKAIKMLCIFWAIAGFSVFIPMLHFVLVPGFFMAGLFFAISAYTDDIRVAAQDFLCLKCSVPMRMREQPDQFPKWLTCDKCGQEHKVDLKK